uniref:Uncharacterized protein n=1 Tax=viral metagenome TaxID=1070528 RepID=A0A6H1ZL60_9ZZZZ
MVELLRIRNTKKGCANESFKNIETPVCDCCGKPHRIVLEEHDSDNLKESIRVIDSNRDYLASKIVWFAVRVGVMLNDPMVVGMLFPDKMIKSKKDGKERLDTTKDQEKRFRETVANHIKDTQTAVREMNDAVREICKENNIYQARKGRVYPPPPKH